MDGVDYLGGNTRTTHIYCRILGLKTRFSTLGNCRFIELGLLPHLAEGYSIARLISGLDSFLHFNVGQPSVARVV